MFIFDIFRGGIGVFPVESEVNTIDGVCTICRLETSLTWIDIVDIPFIGICYYKVALKCTPIEHIDRVRNHWKILHCRIYISPI